MKNQKNSPLKRTAAAVVAILAIQIVGTSPAWAGSKSFSVSVSCSIAPRLEIQSPLALQAKASNSAPLESATWTPQTRTELGVGQAVSGLQINSNLAGGYYLQEKTLLTSSGKIKQISVTG